MNKLTKNQPVIGAKPITKSVCDRCHQLYAQATEGFDGLCPVCVEKEIAEAKARHDREQS